jgi:hypothetical protein
MMTDSFFSNIGSIFFAFWTLAVSSVGVAAFGRDLLPLRATLKSGKTLGSGSGQSTKSIHLD